MDFKRNWLCYFEFYFFKGKKIREYESYILDYVSVFKMFREKICIIYGMRFLKRLWFKSVMMFLKM